MLDTSSKSSEHTFWRAVFANYLLSSNLFLLRNIIAGEMHLNTLNCATGLLSRYAWLSSCKCIFFSVHPGIAYSKTVHFHDILSDQWFMSWMCVTVQFVMRWIEWDYPVCSSVCRALSMYQLLYASKIQILSSVFSSYDFWIENTVGLDGSSQILLRPSNYQYKRSLVFMIPPDLIYLFSWWFTFSKRDQFFSHAYIALHAFKFLSGEGKISKIALYCIALKQFLQSNLL